MEENVLEAISSKNISPSPRWEIFLRNNYFWALGAVTVICGAFAVSASLFVFENIRWDFYNLTHDNIFTFTIEFLPFLWMTLFIGFAVFSYLLIRNTKNGYKYHLPIIIGTVLITSFILGIIFSNFGLGKRIDRGFDGKIPFHRGVESSEEISWNNLKKGLIFGELLEMNGEYFIRNSQGSEIKLLTKHMHQLNLNSLDFDKKIRMIGIQKEEGFYVCGVIENFERKPKLERNKECEGLRPYQRISNLNSRRIYAN